MEYVKYLTVSEAAAILGMTPETIRHWCHKYGFGVRLAPGSHWRIPADRINNPPQVSEEVVA